MNAARLYVQLDVDYSDDPKIIDAGEKAELLYLRALCLSKRLLTDGYISDSQLPRFGLTGAQARAKTLVDVGLWTRANGGYVITAWSKRNKSKEQIEKEQAQRKLDAMRGNHERWHKDKRVVSCPFCESSHDRPPDRPPDSYDDQEGESTEPEPEPEPESSSSSESDLQPADPPSAEEEDEKLGNLWKSWAHLKLRQRRESGREDPDYVAAWLRTVGDDLAEQHLDEARKLLGELPSATTDELLDRLTTPKLTVVQDGHQRHRDDWGSTGAEVWDELPDGTVRRRGETA